MMITGTGGSGSVVGVDWESEAEMQRLLAMLPDIQPSSFDDGHGHGHVDFDLDLDLESEWDLERSGMSVSVF